MVGGAAPAPARARRKAAGLVSARRAPRLRVRHSQRRPGRQEFARRGTSRHPRAQASGDERRPFRLGASEWPSRFGGGLKPRHGCRQPRGAYVDLRSGSSRRRHTHRFLSARHWRHAAKRMATSPGIRPHPTPCLRGSGPAAREPHRACAARDPNGSRPQTSSAWEVPAAPCARHPRWPVHSSCPSASALAAPSDVSSPPHPPAHRGTADRTLRDTNLRCRLPSRPSDLPGNENVTRAGKVLEVGIFPESTWGFPLSSVACPPRRTARTPAAGQSPCPAPTTTVGSNPPANRP